MLTSDSSARIGQHNREYMELYSCVPSSLPVTRYGADTMDKRDTRDIVLLLVWLFLYIIIPFFIIPSCGHNSGHNGSYTSYEDSTDDDYDDRTYYKAMYVDGRWQ